MFSETVTRAGDQHTAAVGQVLGRAFQDDPVMAWIFPDPAERARRTAPMFVTLIRRFHRSYGSVLAAGAPAAPAGAAVWDPPGADVGLLAMAPALPSMITAMGWSGLRRGAYLQAAFERATPREPHWYLAYVGTDPVRQGEGVGSALLRPVLQACDAIGMPAYLECSDPANVAFYERFGFAVVGEVVLPRGPRVPTMLRR